jgi:hypothetical protein
MPGMVVSQLEYQANEMPKKVREEAEAATESASM